MLLVSALLRNSSCHLELASVLSVIVTSSNNNGTQTCEKNETAIRNKRAPCCFQSAAALKSCKSNIVVTFQGNPANSVVYPIKFSSGVNSKQREQEPTFNLISAGTPKLNYPYTPDGVYVGRRSLASMWGYTGSTLLHVQFENGIQLPPVLLRHVNRWNKKGSIELRRSLCRSGKRQKWILSETKFTISRRYWWCNLWSEQKWRIEFAPAPMNGGNTLPHSWIFVNFRGNFSYSRMRNFEGEFVRNLSRGAQNGNPTKIASALCRMRKLLFRTWRDKLGTHVAIRTRVDILLLFKDGARIRTQDARIEPEHRERSTHRSKVSSIILISLTYANKLTEPCNLTRCKFPN